MITVIAGVNGAGKSSVVGSSFRSAGGDYFNPDEVTRFLMSEDPALTLDEANSAAWKMGFENLKSSINNDTDYTFETTLGGNSICSLLLEAAMKDVEVKVIFVGLDSPEKHLERVAARVAKGGHNIPEDKIRARWTGAISNMMLLIPVCRAVAVYDNSNDLVNGVPSPIRVFVMDGDDFVVHPHDAIPDWSKPLATIAMKRNAGI